VAYHASAAVRAACAAAAAWKARGGLRFAAVTGSIAGALLPELAKAIVERGRGQRRRAGPNDGAGALLFRVAFFAVNGVVVDLFYRFAAWLIGMDASPRTVALKVAFDQFVFTPSWLPVIVALFLWRQRGFSVGATAAALRGGGFYGPRVMPLLVPNWCFWIPMVSIIYALPMALQFLLFVLVLAAWSLIMVFIADGEGDAAPAA
jgi:hypothetical protein